MDPNKNPRVYIWVKFAMYFSGEIPWFTSQALHQTLQMLFDAGRSSNPDAAFVSDLFSVAWRETARGSGRVGHENDG